MLSFYPKSEVVQFHNVLTPKLSAFLSNAERDQRYDLPPIRLNPDPKKSLSAAFWIHLETNSSGSEEVRDLGKLVERLTNLKLKNKGVRDTAIQITSYVPGCHISAHRDSVDYDTEKEYARIATLMFYVS